jgi:hypothetical protein
MAAPTTPMQRLVAGTVWSAVIMGAGYLCLTYLTPSRDRLIKVALPCTRALRPTSSLSDCLCLCLCLCV